MKIKGKQHNKYEWSCGRSRLRLWSTTFRSRIFVKDSAISCSRPCSSWILRPCKSSPILCLWNQTLAKLVYADKKIYIYLRRKMLLVSFVPQNLTNSWFCSSLPLCNQLFDSTNNTSCDLWKEALFIGTKYIFITI